METEDILNRIFDKLDKFDSKIDDLCDRATKQETKFDDYLTNRVKNEERKDRNYRISFGIIGLIFGMYAVVKELI